eukprot:2199419-Ditylum_brightwellii.AAC.1
MPRKQNGNAGISSRRNHHFKKYDIKGGKKIDENKTANNDDNHIECYDIETTFNNNEINESDCAHEKCVQLNDKRKGVDNVEENQSIVFDDDDDDVESNSALRNLLMHHCQGADIDHSENSKYDDDIIKDDGNGNNVSGESLKTEQQIIAFVYKHVLGSPSKEELEKCCNYHY